MKKPIQITFRHMDTSPAAEAAIRAEAETLESHYDRITSCRVVVEQQHRHHLRGNGFQVSIDIHVPTSHIIVNHTPSIHSRQAAAEDVSVEKSEEVGAEHKDLYVAIRDAFAAAQRQLDEHVRQLRGETKRHAAATAEAEAALIG